MLIRNPTLIIYAVLVLGLLAAALPPATAQQSYSSEIIINDDGVVKVVINGTAVSGLNKYPAPVDPIISTMTAMLNGKEVASIYVNKTIYIATTANGTIQIQYIGNITSNDNYLEFNINNIGAPVKLIVSPNIVLLDIPSNIISVKNIDGKLVMVILPPATIKYTITKTSQTTTPIPGGTATTTQPQQTTSTPRPQTQTPGQNTAAPPGQPIIPSTTIYILAATIAIAVIGATIYYFKRMRATNIPDILDKTDKMILEEIKKAGGTIMQGELQKILGLPKATLWRRVKKLAQLGFLEITKEGNSNRLILKKKI